MTHTRPPAAPVPPGAPLADRLFSTVVLLTAVTVMITFHTLVGASIVGVVLMSMLVTKTTLAAVFRHRPIALARPGENHRVCIVMPLYHEDPGFASASVRSMLSQTHLPDAIHIVDDGSRDDGAAVDAVRAVLETHAATLGGLGERTVEWTITVLPRNVGKRHALAVGFRGDPAADVFVCVDSDTILDPGAIAAGLDAFGDERVAAVAGLVTAQNWRRNVLTRMIDLRYVSAFLSERAAYSLFGAVLCCCGSLAFFRAQVVRDNLDDFLDQRFLGQIATFGDDRRLTNYALRSGRVVLCERARASTAVPEAFGHYVRQQVRWNKSFFRESIWVLGTFPLGSSVFWLTLWEIVVWALTAALMSATVVLLPLLGHARALLPLMVLVPLAAYARSTAYLEAVRPDVHRTDRLKVFALAPLYAVMHLCVLVPLRCWALITLRRARWGTRGSVEVRMEGPPPPVKVPVKIPTATRVESAPTRDWVTPTLALALTHHADQLR